MDRRMYRSNMGSNVRGRREISPYRSSDPECDKFAGGFTSDDTCGRGMECERDFDVDRFPIGMSYVPWQCFRDLYENEFAALANGTIFKELDLKWYGRGCK